VLTPLMLFLNMRRWAHVLFAKPTPWLGYFYVSA